MLRTCIIHMALVKNTFLHFNTVAMLSGTSIPAPLFPRAIWYINRSQFIDPPINTCQVSSVSIVSECYTRGSEFDVNRGQLYFFPNVTQS